METYGGLKAAAERWLYDEFDGVATVVRPGLVAGPGDYSDRFTYWPVRIARGGEILVPGRRSDRVQYIDVRDLTSWIVTLIENGFYQGYDLTVQGGGTAVRIAASRLRRELGARGAWYRELFRFTQALMGQVAQTAACNRFHKVEPRLARWLLTTRDRVHSSHFYLTHQFLSLMLGVRRVGVTAAAAPSFMAVRRSNFMACGFD